MLVGIQHQLSAIHTVITCELLSSLYGNIITPFSTERLFLVSFHGNHPCQTPKGALGGFPSKNNKRKDPFTIGAAYPGFESEEDSWNQAGKDLHHKNGKFLSFLEFPDDNIFLGKNRN